VLIAQIILVIVVLMSPFAIFVDRATGYGLVAGIAATGLVFVSTAIRPGEIKFLLSTIRRPLVVAAIPALWMVIQLLPIRYLANPIWVSAEAALGSSRHGSITIDVGATVMALGFYLSLIAISLSSAAIAVDRRRAGPLLSALNGATALTAVLLVLRQLLVSLDEVPFDQGAAIACVCIGVIVAVAGLIKTIERERTRTTETQIASPWHVAILACYAAAFAISAVALIIAAQYAAWIAVAYSLAAILGVVVIRRFDLGALGIAALASLPIGLGVLLISHQPNLQSDGPAFAFTSPSSPALISASQRILADTPWPGVGASAFAVISPIYRNIDDPPMPNPPNAVTGLLVELGRPMTVMIGIVICIAIVVLFRASLRRGRDSFYPAAGAACLLGLLLLSFVNDGILATSPAVLMASVIGLAFGQSKSRTI
jgi:hypothetical protein